MKKIYLLLFVCIALGTTSRAQVTTFSENFASLPAMYATGGWTQVNNSVPLGPGTWADGMYLDFATGRGVTSDSNYAEVAYFSTDSIGTGNISNWLISPTVMLNNGDVISFFTTAYNNAFFPDRLEL